MQKFSNINQGFADPNGAQPARGDGATSVWHQEQPHQSFFLSPVMARLSPGPSINK